MMMDYTGYQKLSNEVLSRAGFNSKKNKAGSLINFLKSGGVISKAEILSVFDYDRSNGRFSWAVAMRGGRIGDACDTCSHGYVELRAFKLRVLAHWLVWFLEKGEWPLGFVVDHIDRNRSNNHISNLRLGSQSQNGVNRGPRVVAKSGLRGVSRHKYGLWRARVGPETKYFKTAIEAHHYYQSRGPEIYGEFFGGAKEAT